MSLIHLLSQSVFLLFSHFLWFADPSSFAVYLFLIKIRSIKVNQGKKRNCLGNISYMLQLNWWEGNIRWGFFCFIFNYGFLKNFWLVLIKNWIGYTLFFGSMEAMMWIFKLLVLNFLFVCFSPVTSWSWFAFKSVRFIRWTFC